VAPPAVAELVGGGRGTRYPYKPIGLTLTGQMSKMSKTTAAGTESIAGCVRIPGPGSNLLQCHGCCDNWLLCNDYLPRAVITITSYFRDPITW